MAFNILTKNSKRKVCVIGAGAIGMVHIEGYKQLADCELVVVEPDNDKSRQLSAEGTATFDSLLQVKNMYFDLYDICVPTHMHAAILEQLLSTTQGAILCEKPIVLDSKQLKRLIANHPDMHSRVMCAFVERFNHPFLLLKKWSSAHPGPFTMSFSRRTKKPTMTAWFNHPELGGDIVLDLGIHDIDLALWFNDAAVVSVSHHKLVDNDHESFRLTLSDGSTVDFYLGWDLPESHAIGIENYVKIQSGKECAAYNSNIETVELSGKFYKTKPRFPAAYYDEVAAALVSVKKDNGFAKMPSIVQGLHVVDMIKAIRQAGEIV